MITVQLPPIDTFRVEFKDQETAGQMVQRIIDQNELEIRGTWGLQDSSQGGRLVSQSEIVMDGRIYNLIATITYPHKSLLVHA